MTAPDPYLAEIAARFAAFDMQASRGGYTLHHRRSRIPGGGNRGATPKPAQPRSPLPGNGRSR
jgi:hypothetical protein